MAIAYPAGTAKLREIEGAILVHVTKAEHRAAIIQNTDPAGLPHWANCEIHLVAGQGWSVAPFRLLRDYSVLDPHLASLKDYGCYTYFFLGEPGWWAVKKNIGAGAKWGDLGPDLAVFRIQGSDLLACADLLFYRPDDRVVVIRGDYKGPAQAEPAP